MPDGRLHETIFVEMAAAFEIRDRLHATAIEAERDGTPVPPPPPQPSEVQRWMEIAYGDPFLEDAFIYFGKAVDWFDIYKALECLILRFGGGSESAFLELAWTPKADVKLLKQTANWARHARRKFDLPEKPMPIREARKLMAKLLRRALNEP
jgi:hypothetical protein